MSHSSMDIARDCFLSEAREASPARTVTVWSPLTLPTLESSSRESLSSEMPRGQISVRAGEGGRDRRRGTGVRGPTFSPTPTHPKTNPRPGSLSLLLEGRLLDTWKSPTTPPSSPGPISEQQLQDTSHSDPSLPPEPKGPLRGTLASSFAPYK